MDDLKKQKLKAAGKIAFGAFKMTSGVLTATGHGLMGGYLRRHHMMQAAIRLGANSVKSGTETITEGLDEWKKLKG